MRAGWRNVLLLAMAIQTSAAKADAVGDALKPTVERVKKCSDTLLLDFFERVFTYPPDETNQLESEAGYYTREDGLEYRNGHIYFSWYYTQIIDGEPFPKLSLYMSQDGLLFGTIYDKNYGTIASFSTSGTTMAAPHFVYRTKVDSYEVDRFGRIINVVEQLDTLTLVPDADPVDEMRFVNQFTMQPMGFTLPGLAAYRSCLLGD
jgi:hypothetical protein